MNNKQTTALAILIGVFSGVIFLGEKLNVEVAPMVFGGVVGFLVMYFIFVVLGDK